jgi:hypothetical protein
VYDRTEQGEAEVDIDISVSSGQVIGLLPDGGLWPLKPGEAGGWDVQAFVFDAYPLLRDYGESVLSESRFSQE